jgi:Cu/Ag efflux pump CusA
MNWRTYADLDEFKRSKIYQAVTGAKQVSATVIDTLANVSAVSHDEWQRRWKTHRATLVHGEKMAAKRNLANQLIIMIVCLPIFLIHWRLARKTTNAGY